MSSPRKCRDLTPISFRWSAPRQTRSICTPRSFYQGRYFTDEEDNRLAKVAVLGYDIAHALFPNGNAVGRTFMMDGAEYTIVGVFEKAKGGFLGENGAGY